MKRPRTDFIQNHIIKTQSIFKFGVKLKGRENFMGVRYSKILMFAIQVNFNVCQFFRRLNFISCDVTVRLR